MLRGVCLLEMMANHLPTNVLTERAVETVGFVSAAEGFVFLSGFVAGWTSIQAMRAGRTPQMVTKRFVSRARQLYTIYLGMLTVMVLAAAIGGNRFSEWRQLCDFRGGSTETLWLLGATFLHLPKYLDIFSMYCVFLLAVPLTIRQLKEGRHWLVLAWSAGLWAISQVWRVPEPPVLLRFGFFNLFAWQFIFTAGVTFGYRHDPTKRVRSRWLFMLSMAVCAAFLAIRYPALARPLGLHLPHLDPYGISASIFSPSKMVEKSTLGLLRLVNFAALAYLTRYAIQWLMPSVETTWAFRRLAFLGQHSLQVFSWSIGVTLVLFLSGESWQRLPLVMQAGLFLLVMATLWIPAMFHKLWRGRKTLPQAGLAVRATVTETA